MRLFRKFQQKMKWSVRQYLLAWLAVFFCVYLSSALYHSGKSMPEGLNYTGEMRSAKVEFLYDKTYLQADGSQHLQQQIFDRMLQMIQQAQSTIVLDMFLFNATQGSDGKAQRPLTEQLTHALIQKRREYPNVSISVLTDPINSFYGGILPEHYQQLRQAGIDVIETNLTPLPASNPTWSGLWYMCCQSLGNSTQGWLPAPFGEQKVTLRSYLHLLNFKANHRKMMIVDGVEGWQTLISSANPHNGSSRHSNVALVVHDGGFASDALKSEFAVARLSGGNVPSLVIGNTAQHTESEMAQVQLVTEQAIYERILQMIEQSQADSQLDLMMFYLSERNIIHALKSAHQRGVKIRILLDRNQDAFGRQKNGIPNQPVASELHKAGIEVRWCNTQGEQCHGKMLLHAEQQQRQLILGSANFTARNLKNYNLESDVWLKTTAHHLAYQTAQRYFDDVWHNRDGQLASVEYQQYADESTWKYWQYRLMEWSGLSTF